MSDTAGRSSPPEVGIGMGASVMSSAIIVEVGTGLTTGGFSSDGVAPLPPLLLLPPPISSPFPLPTPLSSLPSPPFPLPLLFSFPPSLLPSLPLMFVGWAGSEDVVIGNSTGDVGSVDMPEFVGGSSTGNETGGGGGISTVGRGGGWLTLSLCAGGVGSKIGGEGGAKVSGVASLLDVGRGNTISGTEEVGVPMTGIVSVSTKGVVSEDNGCV